MEKLQSYDVKIPITRNWSNRIWYMRKIHRIIARRVWSELKTDASTFDITLIWILS